MALPLQNPVPFQPSPTSNPLKSPPLTLRLFFLAILCSISYFLASFTKSKTISLPPPLRHCFPLNFSSHSSPFHSLDFEPHHTLPFPPEPPQDLKFFPSCSSNLTHYFPCNGQLEKWFGTEHHCRNEKLRCLIPRPLGYRRPFPWPKSKEYAWFSNVPFSKLIEYKKVQNWVQLEGEMLFFPGGGTSFRMGVKGYIDEIKRVVPLKSGIIRTALDIGCGVASFGAALMEYNILTMSIAPQDEHEGQVQFALERGLPAMLGLLSTDKLPFPSRSFDMAHCSRCLVQWTAFDGLYLMEIDRVLRPGGYWILSGPPINWKEGHKNSSEKALGLKNEYIRLENIARRLCWKKISESGPTVVWRKPSNHIHCNQKAKISKYHSFCVGVDPDASWHKEMNPCITPLPNVSDIHRTSGGAVEKWPKRLMVVPSRIKSGTIEGINAAKYDRDSQVWKKRVAYYGVLIKSLFSGKYRNVMDMNAGLGSFAASLVKYPMWVMNVVPFDASNDTLGVVYARGLIGTYMDWCESFSTYPRTYDLIHAHYLFSAYINKCDIVDIVLEMYRILRPEGAVIIRDHVDIIVKVRSIMKRMRWSGQIFHSENGPFHPEKILLVHNFD